MIACYQKLVGKMSKHLKKSMKSRENQQLLASLFDGNCNGNCHTNHGVVTCAEHIVCVFPENIITRFDVSVNDVSGEFAEMLRFGCFHSRP